MDYQLHDFETVSGSGPAVPFPSGFIVVVIGLIPGPQAVGLVTPIPGCTEVSQARSVDFCSKTWQARPLALETGTPGGGIVFQYVLWDDAASLLPVLGRCGSVRQRVVPRGISWRNVKCLGNMVRRFQTQLAPSTR